MGILEEILAKLDEILVVLNSGAQPTPTPPETEPPPQKNRYVVSIGKTNCRVLKGYNENAKKPIMWLPPKKDRITFLQGEKFWIDPNVIDADGSTDYFEIVKADLRPKAVGLFCRVQDVKAA